MTWSPPETILFVAGIALAIVLGLPSLIEGLEAICSALGG